MESSKEGTVMMSLQDLKSIHYDEVDWTVLLHRLMFKPNSTHIIKDDHMIVTRPSYIATLKDLMTKTAPRTVANLLSSSKQLRLYLRKNILVKKTKLKLKIWLTSL